MMSSASRSVSSSMVMALLIESGATKPGWPGHRKGVDPAAELHFGSTAMFSMHCEQAHGFIMHKTDSRYRIMLSSEMTHRIAN